jgi:hypothetical protein
MHATKHIFVELYEMLQALGVTNSVLENETLPQSREFALNNYGEWRHKETGESPADWVAKLKERKPFWFEGYVSPEQSEAQEARQIIAAATERPTPASLGKLFRYYGERKAKEIIEAAGVDIARMRPGTKKLVVADDGKTEAVERDADKSANNPFSAKGWNLSRQGALVRACGVARAAAIAKSVGVRLGDTRPNPKYN